MVMSGPELQSRAMTQSMALVNLCVSGMSLAPVTAKSSEDRVAELPGPHWLHHYVELVFLLTTAAPEI